jgi:hypothetical protein
MAGVLESAGLPQDKFDVEPNIDRLDEETNREFSHQKVRRVPRYAGRVVQAGF